MVWDGFSQESCWWRSRAATRAGTRKRQALNPHERDGVGHCVGDRWMEPIADRPWSLLYARYFCPPTVTSQCRWAARSCWCCVWLCWCGSPRRQPGSACRSRRSAHCAGQQSRIGWIGHIGRYHCHVHADPVSAQQLHLRRLGQQGLIEPVDRRRPHRVVSFINVVGCGTNPSNGIRQNRAAIPRVRRCLEDARHLAERI